MLVHFVFGLSDEEEKRQFRFCHYLSVRSASVHLQPARLLLHYHHLPTGTAWAQAAPLVELHKVELPRSRSATELKHAAHRADVLRLELLIAHGGIYLDLDVVVIQPFARLLQYEFVLAKEGDESHGGFHGLCNAVLIARPNASFARRWLASYSTFGSSSGDAWSEHSVQLPGKLAAAHPSEVLVLPYSAFFWPDWHDRELKQLLLERGSVDHLAPRHGARSGGSAVMPGHGSLDHAPTDGVEHELVGYAVHLWSSQASAYVLEHWSAEYVATVASSLNCVLQQSILPLPLPPLHDALSRNCSCGSAVGRRTAASARGAGSHGVGPRYTAAHDGRLRLVLLLPLTQPLSQPASPGGDHLLLDASGGCLHGWIYSKGCGVVAPSSSQPESQHDGHRDSLKSADRKPPLATQEKRSVGAGLEGGDVGRGAAGRRQGDQKGGASGLRGCWREAASPFSQGRTLSFSDGLEAFVPLPAAPLHAWSISWWARIDSLHADCGGETTWFSLAFADGEVIVGAAPHGGLHHPTIRSTRRSSWLRWGGVLMATSESVCSNGWHHYLLVSSTNAVDLHVDGSLVLTSPLSLGMEGAVPRGLWLGGTEPTIAGRTPPAAAQSPTHVVSMGRVALFEGSMAPANLPPSCLSTDGGWRPEPTRVAHRTPAAGLATTLASIWPSRRPRSLGVRAACPACLDMLPVPSLPRSAESHAPLRERGASGLSLDRLSALHALLMVGGGAAVVYLHFFRCGLAREPRRRAR